MRLIDADKLIEILEENGQNLEEQIKEKLLPLIK